MVDAGWYPDPDGTPDRLRYWDGVSWTGQTRALNLIKGFPPAGAATPATDQRAAGSPWEGHASRERFVYDPQGDPTPESAGSPAPQVASPVTGTGSPASWTPQAPVFSGTPGAASAASGPDLEADLYATRVRPVDHAAPHAAASGADAGPTPPWNWNPADSNVPEDTFVPTPPAAPAATTARKLPTKGLLIAAASVVVVAAVAAALFLTGVIPGGSDSPKPTPGPTATSVPADLCSAQLGPNVSARAGFVTMTLASGWNVTATKPTWSSCGLTATSGDARLILAPLTRTDEAPVFHAAQTWSWVRSVLYPGTPEPTMIESKATKVAGLDAWVSTKLVKTANSSIPDEVSVTIIKHPTQGYVAVITSRQAADQKASQALVAAMATIAVKG